MEEKYIYIILVACMQYANALGNIIEMEPVSGERISSMALDKKLNLMLDVLGELKFGMQSLKSRILEVERELKTDDRKKTCEPKDKTLNYIVRHCGNHTKNYKRYYLVDADFGSYHAHGFCRVIIPDLVKGSSYKISARLYNNYGPRGENSGYIGLAYNVQDEFNFDFVYLKLHLPETCYRSGFYQNGKPVWTNAQTGPCVEGPPKGRTWFKMQVLVHDTNAELWLDEVKITGISTHYPARGRGGIVVAAGYRNIIQFKHFNITTINKSNFKFSSCGSTTAIGENYFLMESEVGDWPDAGFCQAVSKISLKRENYAVSVSLYNQAIHSGRTPGLLGVLYNVQNQYNFDFVYFRPKSAGGCFTTGFVQNSQIQWDNSRVGSCTGGPIETATWFEVRVKVHGERVSVAVNGRHVLSTRAHFSPIGRGGVLVGNGNNAAVVFRNYQVQPIEPHPFTFVGCAPESKEIADYIILDASHGKWPRSTFCRAVSKKESQGRYYLLAAELFIQSTEPNEEIGISGIMYNVKDANNYDFFYISPHNIKQCFKAGFVLNGEIQWFSLLSGECPADVLRLGHWISVEVKVNGDRALVWLGGRHVLSYKPHFDATGKGGVIVGNGFHNVLSFRDFINYEMKPNRFSYHTCGEGTHTVNQTVVLDASLPLTQPPSFCRVIQRRDNITYASNYTIQAEFYNVDSWVGGDWGRIGLMYNVRDENNFDFITINMHIGDGECYQAGHMFAGVTKFNRDYVSECTTPRPTNKWFTLTALVTELTNRVKITLDGQEIATLSLALPYVIRGGALVPNGHKNVVMLKMFSTIVV